MIHELREYQFTQENWERYKSLFYEVAWPLRQHDFGILKGAWTTRHQGGTVGFLHLWEYDSLDARARLRAQLASKGEWMSGFIQPVKALLSHQTLSVLNPMSCGAEAQLPKHGFLHRVACRIGRVSRVIAQSQGAGSLIWTTEFPNPNEIALIRTGAQVDFLSNPSPEMAGLVESVRVTVLEQFVLPIQTTMTPGPP